MFLPGLYYAQRAEVDDSVWQGILDRHGFWKRPAPESVDDEHVGAAFHILAQSGKVARKAAGAPVSGKYKFDAVQIPDKVLRHPAVRRTIDRWVALHEQNIGDGLALKLGIYVFHPGGHVGYHVDGPIFLKGMRANLSDPEIQKGIELLHASTRTVLPLRFNAQDEFLVCGNRVPLARGRLFEFSNVLPHAFYNRGSEPAALLVMTYLIGALVPQLPGEAR